MLEPAKSPGCCVQNFLQLEQQFCSSPKIHGSEVELSFKHAPFVPRKYWKQHVQENMLHSETDHGEKHFGLQAPHACSCALGLCASGA